MSLVWMLKGLVAEWCEEYNIEKGAVIFDSFADLEPNTMGICRCFHDGQPCRIVMSDHWNDLGRLPEFLLRSVLWHEFCHGDSWIQSQDDTHGKTFKEKRARKTLYMYGDYIAKFMWGIWRLIYKW